ncbi:hypothetical protein R5R35_004044 [Gryllus longicercus]|uniref:Uncharacterized protein n=1 Tax=Gryllus longicercus TaxID=2509291 RepID=A0AAN9VNM4_9ORTH
MEQTHLDEEAYDEWKKQMIMNWASLCDAAADLAIIAHNSSLQRPYYAAPYRSIIDVAVDVACAARRCHEEIPSDAEEDKEKTLHNLAITCHEKVLWMMMVLGEVNSCLCCECEADDLFVRYCVIQKALNAPCDSFNMPPPFIIDNDKQSPPFHNSYGAEGVGKRRSPQPEEFILTVHAEVLAVLEALGHLLQDPYGEALRQRVSRVRQIIQTLRCPFENTPPAYSPAHSDSDSDEV